VVLLVLVTVVPLLQVLHMPLTIVSGVALLIHPDILESTKSVILSSTPFADSGLSMDFEKTVD